MKLITSKQELREALRPLRSKRIGLVPTMGYLHQGHLSLVQRAKEQCDVVVMSIFVNPIQFGPNEDLDSYPRDLERDQKLAESAGVDFLFHPSVEEMYPKHPLLTRVQVNAITEKLCGASRPGHFDGVTTVVSKLFHIVQPDFAYFGLKDAQQVAVIEQMVYDLDIPVTIIPCDIVREADGLALSSRNVYLSAEERKQALILSKSLLQVKEAWKTGAFQNAQEVNSYVRDRIQTQPLADIDYVETLAYPSLEKPVSLFEQDILIAVAVRFGKTRLIDNTLIHNHKE